MKSIIFSLFLMFLCNCSQDPTSSTDSHAAVYIGIDKTSSTEYSSPPSAMNILSHVCTDENVSLEVLVSEINDVSLTPVYRYYRESKKLLDNPMSRKDSIDSFNASVDIKLQEIFTLPNGKTRSSIYLLLCKIVKDISATGAKDKTLILFTDFMENSSLTTSFYTLFNRNPDFINSYNTIVEKLESADVLGDLSGINIIVVFEPDLGTDGLFHQTRKFWTRYLNSKGAKVEFVANL